MPKLTNNQTLSIIGGTYALKATGALDVQWQLADESFDTITNGSFSTAGDGIATLPICIIKCANAASNTLIIKKAN